LIFETGWISRAPSAIIAIAFPISISLVSLPDANLTEDFPGTMEGQPMPRGTRRKPKFLPTKLREIREALGLSQDGIIERLGLANYMSRGKISDFERGVREPDLLTLKAYADEAGVSVDYLIDDNVRLPERLPGTKQTGN
jgi:Helix-turn-helix